MFLTTSRIGASEEFWWFKQIANRLTTPSGNLSDAGTQNITVTFSGLQSTPAFPQAVVSEIYNIATAAALDGSAVSANSLAPGDITTTAPGDLIYQWGVDLSDTNLKLH